MKNTLVIILSVTFDVRYYTYSFQQQNYEGGNKLYLKIIIIIDMKKFPG